MFMQEWKKGRHAVVLQGKELTGVVRVLLVVLWYFLARAWEIFVKLEFRTMQAMQRTNTRAQKRFFV